MTTDEKRQADRVHDLLEGEGANWSLGMSLRESLNREQRDYLYQKRNRIYEQRSKEFWEGQPKGLYRAWSRLSR